MKRAGIKLGDKLRDRLTGFEGIAVARIEYLNGCVQYELAPAALKEDGGRHKAEWFDVQRLEGVRNERFKPSTALASVGGPTRDDTRPTLSRP